MDSNITVKETTNYITYVSDPVEGVAKERHYACLNKIYGVVEFRTPVLFNALQYMQESESEFESEFLSTAIEEDNGEIKH